MEKSRFSSLLPPKPLGLASVLGAAALTAGLVISSSEFSPAQAVTFGFSSITNNKVADAATGESQLFVDVTDAGNNQVLFKFTNVGPNASSITGIYFDDGSLLGIASIADNGAGVNFSTGATPGDLPGGNSISPQFETTAGFLADSDEPVQPNGVNPGEFVSILFDLQAGKTFADTLTALQTPDFSPNGLDLRIGVHVQGFEGGGSESFVNNPQPVPEPASMLGIMAFGALGGGRLLRKKKQQAAQG